MKDYGLVSIITPAYNTEKYIGETIECVLSQTYTNWELIIVDDFSTDDTKHVIDKYLYDKRIKYFYNTENLGEGLTRNIAIENSRGKWVAILDSDDLWLPEKLEKQLEFMVTNNYDFTYHDYIEINETGDEIGVYNSGLKVVNNIDLYLCNWIGCLTVIYNSEKIGKIKTNGIRNFGDYALWLNVINKSKCFLLPNCLAKYRRRENSLSKKRNIDKLKCAFNLYRDECKMNKICTVILIVLNVFISRIKKICFSKKYE